MITDRQIELLSQRYILSPTWIRGIRDMDFLSTYANVPEELHESLNRIDEELRSEAWKLTQILYPNAELYMYGLIWILGESPMAPLSDSWWSLVAQKADEVEQELNQ